MDNERIDELSLGDRLGYMVKTGVKNARDRVLAGFGNATAMGRLNQSAGTNELYKKWLEYVGQKSQTIPNLKDQPTLKNLSNFFQIVYQLEISPESLQKIANGHNYEDELDARKALRAKQRAAAAAKTKAQQSQSQPQSQEPQEPTAESYLKKVFGAPYGTLNEKFVVEAGNAANEIFDPRELFPKLAVYLMDSGVMNVNRPNLKNKGSAFKNAEDDQDTDYPKDKANNLVTKSGFGVDANKYTNFLMKFHVSESDLHAFGNYSKTQTAILEGISKNDMLQRVVPALAYSLCFSITRDVDDPTALVTNKGHAVNFNTVIENLEKYRVRTERINDLRKELHNMSVPAATAKMNQIMTSWAHDDDMKKTAYVIAGLALAAYKATVTVK